MVQDGRRGRFFPQALVLLACSSAAFAAPPMRILIDSPPVTLNPRMTQDANGQRLTALLYPALTRLDERLQPRSDLADSWSHDASYRRWSFTLRRDLLDHGGEPLTADALRLCFEQYLSGKPLALATQALTRWKSLQSKGRTLVFELEAPDPYFPRNATLLRYFRQPGKPACSDPSSDPTIPLIGAGEYRSSVGARPPDNDLLLERRNSNGGFEPHARFLFVRDENTRLIRLLRGEVDIAQNAISPARFRWMSRNHGDRFELVEAPGANISYLSFNLRHPLLARIEVRRALALAVPVQGLARGKFADMVEPASSLLSPLLPDSATPPIARDNPTLAEKLLDSAGFPRGEGGVRFSLKFKTTPVREGYETVRVLQESFRKIGVRTELEVVEPAVFQAAVRRGAYELSLGRWVGVADPSILDRTLRTGSPLNRAGYSNPLMDQLLDSRRWPEAQARMIEDLPYFPLWFWKNAVLVRREFEAPKAEALSLTGGLAPLLEISRKRY